MFSQYHSTKIISAKRQNIVIHNFRSILAKKILTVWLLGRPTYVSSLAALVFAAVLFFA